MTAAAMAGDAGLDAVAHAPVVVLADDAEDHNGYSTVVPRGLVLVWLAPALLDYSVFCHCSAVGRSPIASLTVDRIVSITARAVAYPSSSLMSTPKRPDCFTRGNAGSARP